MFCQACGAQNRDEDEHCHRCHQKLLVVSGESSDGAKDLVEDLEESFAFDEHLLERISILEEVAKRTTESVRQLLGAVGRQERNILINQTGLETLREVLEGGGVLRREEWTDLWESKMDYQLLALEKRERFVAIKDRVGALYRGDKRKLFHDFLDEAEYALYAFDIDRALSALESAFKLDHDNYELAYFIGETYFNEGAVGQALEYFDRVLEANPDHYEGLVYSGIILHERGAPERAEEMLKRAVELNPDSFLPHFSLGTVYNEQGRLSLAEIYLEKAVELDGVPQAYYLLGSCQYEQGKLGPAITSLREAVRHDPAFEEAHHLLGLAYLDRHWNRKALAAFRQAQRLNPKRMRYEDLIRCLSGQEAGSPLPDVSGRAAEWLSKAEELINQGKPERAISCYRRAIALEPDNPTLLMGYAMACAQLDRSSEIEVVARRVLDLDPGEKLKASAYATLIEALRSEGRFKEGNRIGKLLLDEGDSNFAKTLAYYELAFNLAEMEENLDQALDYAERALELSPEELRQFPLAALGWVHFKRRELEEAVEFLARSSEADPSASTLTHLGLALLASGEEERARGVLAEARKLGGHGGVLERKVMECLRDSSRLVERARRQKK